jgi:hypothetical protein
MRSIQRAILCTFFLTGATICALAQSNNGGRMNFFMRTNSGWDQFTNSFNPYIGQWLNQNFWRMQVSTPYFDSRTGWYPNAWAYQDLYGQWSGTSLANEHPDWVLRDGNGNPLYVPWGCWGSGCPNLAFDPGNPGFQQWWINNAKQVLSHGYKGLWIDDVNMEYRVGYGDGSQATPWNPRTGAPMTYDEWKSSIADFTQQIRWNLPNAEIVHNSIWFAGGDQRDYDPNVIREIQSADYINCERGISDDGLTGGDGPWSVNAFLRFVDHVHSLGAHVIFDEYTFNGEYGIAGYFLINDGRDAFGNQQVAPFYTAAEYFVDLGDPKGPRYNWNGMLRRDFANGTVLVNPARSNWVSANMAGNAFNIFGSWSQNISLSGGQGLIIKNNQ